MTKNKLFQIACIGIFILGMALRIYDFKERFYFGHDNDLASWIVKDIVVDHHTRLIGQLTSAPGIFIGSLFYYLLVPFYVLGNMDPVTSVGFSWAIGAMSMLSLYTIVAKLHGKKTGVISLLIYAVSFSIVSTEREVVPTTLVFLWSMWFYYAATIWLAGKKHALYIFAVLFAVVWHIHLVLGILSSIAAIGLLVNLKKLDIKTFIKAALLCVVLISPLLLFELRHDFSQTKSLFGSFGQHARVERSLPDKFAHVIEYMEKNINQIAWDRPQNISPHVIPLILLIGLAILIYLKKISLKTTIVIGLWIAVLTSFFALHPINLSEYYLNSLNIVWIVVAALTLSVLSKSKLGKPIVLAILFVFAVHNISRLTGSNINHSGYVERSAIINAIAQDAKAHNFPCVSISYITDPGSNLGYRYLIWRQDLKTAPISTQTPVYSIVFPHTRVDRLDQTFGALGLIHPDYSRYNQEGIIKSCSGSDYNISESMFGFTK